MFFEILGPMGKILYKCIHVEPLRADMGQNCAKVKSWSSGSKVKCLFFDILGPIWRKLNRCIHVDPMIADISQDSEKVILDGNP